MKCSVCQNSDSLSFSEGKAYKKIAHCHYCGAPAYDKRSQLNAQDCALLQQQWEQWGRKKWQTQDAIQTELNGEATPAVSPLLGQFASSVSDKVSELSDRWLSDNAPASDAVDKLNNRIRAFFKLVGSSGNAASIPVVADVKVDVLEKQSIEVNAEDTIIGDLKELESARDTVIDENSTDTTAIAEESLIAVYNQDISCIRSSLVVFEQTADSIKKYFEEHIRHIELRVCAGDNGKYWALQDKQPSGKVVYYLMPRKDRLFHESYLDSVEACFEFKNGAVIANTPFDLISLALIEPVLNHHQLWRLIRRGSIRFREERNAS